MSQIIKWLSCMSLALTLSVTAIAQQDPQLTMFTVPKLLYNPASAGMNNGYCGYLINRQQWVGYEGRPETYLFGAHGTFNLSLAGRSMRNGVGISVMGDGLGQMRFFGMKTMYSAHIPVKYVGGEPAYLGIGASVGMLQFSIGNNWRSFDDYFLDPLINDVGYKLSKLDADFGLWYSVPNKLYFGISATHLNGAKYSSDGQELVPFGGVPWNSSFQMVRHYYVTAQYRWPVPGNELFIIVPSLLVKTDLVTAQVDVNGVVEWNNFLFGGASWRYNDAAALLAGVIYNGPLLPLGTLRAGYSYDVTTSNLRQGSNGSHELFLQYCLTLKQKSPITRHKSVRFL